MNKKELQEFNEKTDGLAKDLPEKQSLDQWISLAFLHFMKFSKHFADATRQLTIANEHRKHQATGGGALIAMLIRIANALDLRNYHDGLAPDANIRFEILAKAFFYDTKMMAPGKMQAASESSPGHSIEERQDAWRKWLKENDVLAPAPDVPTVALVEAVKEARLYIRSTLPMWNRAEDLPPIMHKIDKALAAHEKEKSR